MREGEHIQQSRRGIELQSLPRPWDQVSIFLKNYITCEGRYQMVYYSEFPLLSHLRHKALLNIPFYLFRDLQFYTIWRGLSEQPSIQTPPLPTMA